MRIWRKPRWRPRWLRRLELRLKTSLAKKTLKRIDRNPYLRDRVLEQPWARDVLLRAMAETESGVRGEMTAEHDAHMAEAYASYEAHRASTQADVEARIAKEYATCHQPWHWDQHRWKQRPRKRFLFIVGCGHSGTTILHRLLAEHPQIHGIVQESNLFINFTDDKILDQLRDWEREADDAGKSVVLEKTPFHLYYFNRINEFAGDCSFVSMIRDGRDVVASYMASGRSEQWGIDYWTQCMRYEDEISSKLKHHHQVRLEDLVDAPHTTLTTLLNRLGLDASEHVLTAMLDYHKRPKAYYHSEIQKPPNALEGENMAKHRTYQVNQPLFATTGRWRNEIPQDRWDAVTKGLMPWLQSYGYLTDSLDQQSFAAPSPPTPITRHHRP